MLSLLTLASIASLATAANVNEFKSWLTTVDSEVFVTAEPTKMVSFLYDLGMLEASETSGYALVYSKVYELFSGVVPVSATQDIEDMYASATDATTEVTEAATTLQSKSSETTKLADPEVPVQLANGGHRVAVPVACMAAAGVAML